MSYYKDLTTREFTEINNLINFCTELVIKDSNAADAGETRESSVQAFSYLAAINKTDSILNYPNGDKYYFSNEEEKEKALNELRQIRIDSYTEMNKYYKDLHDNYNVSYSKARLANDYDLLYYPKDNYLSPEQSRIFADLYYSCMRYYTNVIDNPAFYHYDLYRNFSRFFIVMMTLDRYISSKLDNIHNYDLFDAWSLRNMFISYDLDYFYDLPIRYQRRLLKNLNILIKNKGTNKAVVDIVSLFGFENVTIFKHFLAKDYSSFGGKFLSLDKPDLKFYKVDYRSKNIQKDLKNEPADDYDTFISDDPYWHAEKEDILKESFNFINTKYFSVTSAVDLLKTTFSTSYLFNMIKHVEKEQKYKDALRILDTSVSPNYFSLTDAVVAINILLLDYLGYEDNIIKESSSIAKVYGYNFDKEFIYQSLIKATTNKYLSNPVRSYHITSGEFVKAYNENYDLRESIDEVISNSDDFFTVRKYQKLKQVQFTTTLNYDIYGDYKTYSDYLKNSNKPLLEYVNNLKNTDNSRKGILELVNSLEQFIQVKDSSNLLNFTPIVEYIENFLRILIDIFKSYTTELKDIDHNFIINDRINERIHLLEHKYVESQTRENSILPLEDLSANKSEFLKTMNFGSTIGDYADVLMLILGFSNGNVISDVDQLSSIFDNNDTLYINEKVSYLTEAIKANKFNIGSFSTLTTLIHEISSLNLDDGISLLSGEFRNNEVMHIGDTDITTSSSNKFSTVNIKDKIVNMLPSIVIGHNRIIEEFWKVTAENHTVGRELFILGDLSMEKSSLMGTHFLNMNDAFLLHIEN